MTKPSEHFVEVCLLGFVHGQCKCPGPKTVSRITCPTAGQHAGDWLVWDELRMRPVRRESVARNVVVWIIGPDDAPTALEIEQTDGKVYPLCTFSAVADATFLGYLVSRFAGTVGLQVYQSMESKVNT